MELTLLSYVDLMVQLALLILLLIDYFVLQRKSLKQHGAILTIAFVANTITLLVIMLPPFLNETGTILENLYEAESLLFLSHHILGLLAEFLGGFLVLRWALKRFNSSSCSGTNLMRLTMSTWVISILMGIILFLWHFIEL